MRDLLCKFGRRCTIDLDSLNVLAVIHRNRRINIGSVVIIHRNRRVNIGNVDVGYDSSRDRVRLVFEILSVSDTHSGCVDINILIVVRSLCIARDLRVTGQLRAARVLCTARSLFVADSFCVARTVCVVGHRSTLRFHPLRESHFGRSCAPSARLQLGIGHPLSGTWHSGQARGHAGLAPERIISSTSSLTYQDDEDRSNPTTLGRGSATKTG